MTVWWEWLVSGGVREQWLLLLEEKRLFWEVLRKFGLKEETTSSYSAA